MTPTEKARRSDALHQGPDTRRVLCDMIANRESDLEELMDENAKLRTQLADVTESMGRVEERCAKLRELVRDLWRFTGTACKKYPRLFDPAAQGGQMVYPNMIDAFEQRMRELGVYE